MSEAGNRRGSRAWDESDVRIRPNKKGSRPRTKNRPAYEEAETGRVVTVDRGRYTTVVDEDTPDERIVIAARARELRRSDLEGSAGIYRLKEELLRRVNLAIYPAHVESVLFKEILVQ